MSDEPLRIKITPTLAAKAVNESPWRNGLSLTREQNEVVEDLALSGFEIIVHQDGAVELRRE